MVLSLPCDKTVSLNSTFIHYMHIPFVLSYDICDPLSKNMPHIHFPVFQEMTIFDRCLAMVGQVHNSYIQLVLPAGSIWSFMTLQALKEPAHQEKQTVQQPAQAMMTLCMDTSCVWLLMN